MRSGTTNLSRQVGDVSSGLPPKQGDVMRMLRRLAAFLRRSRMDETLRAEIEHHLAMREQALVAEGRARAPQEARATAGVVAASSIHFLPLSGLGSSTYVHRSTGRRRPSPRGAAFRSR